MTLSAPKTSQSHPRCLCPDAPHEMSPSRWLPLGASSNVSSQMSKHFYLCWCDLGVLGSLEVASSCSVLLCVSPVRSSGDIENSNVDSSQSLALAFHKMRSGTADRVYRSASQQGLPFLTKVPQMPCAHCATWLCNQCLLSRYSLTIATLDFM